MSNVKKILVGLAVAAVGCGAGLTSAPAAHASGYSTPTKPTSSLVKGVLTATCGYQYNGYMVGNFTLERKVVNKRYNYTFTVVGYRYPVGIGSTYATATPYTKLRINGGDWKEYPKLAGTTKYVVISTYTSNRPVSGVFAGWDDSGSQIGCINGG